MSSLKKVAEKAEVSITTVSRVINKPEKVKPDTRERVKKTMRILGYKPSRVAQRLRSNKGRSKLLGLIIPDIQNPYYSNIVRGIEDVTYDNNYALILCNSDEDSNKERFYLDVLKSESVDGVILPPIHQYGKAINEIIKSGIPIICVDRKIAKGSVDSVVVNNYKGAYSAVSHLIELSHSKIGFITSSYQYSSFQQRQKGYEQALKDNNIEINESFIKEADPRSSDEAKELTLEMMKKANAPTALFVTNNLMTLGVLQAIHKLNFNIPDDISVIMFDDMSWASVMSPPLTVVKQPSYEMGRRAAELFFQRISDPDREAVEVTLEPKLIIRKSTSSPKSKELPGNN